MENLPDVIVIDHVAEESNTGRICRLPRFQFELPGKSYHPDLEVPVNSDVHTVVMEVPGEIQYDYDHNAHLSLDIWQMSLPLN